MNLERFDEFYFTICKETGGIEGLLHSLFSFLYRRTDFYHESDPGDKMGFPPGVSARILFQVYDQYLQQYYKKFPKKDPKEYEEKLKKYKEKMEQMKAQEKQIKQVKAEEKNLEKQENLKSTQSAINAQNPTPEEANTKNEQSEQSKNNKPDVQLQSSKNDTPTQLQSNLNKGEQEKKNLQSSISTYNGGETEKYSWSQSISDLTVEFKLPKISNKKNIAVELKSDRIKIQYRDEKQPYIEGQFFLKINLEDSTWSIEDEKKLVLHLEKSEEQIWKTVLKGDKEIDATKVDNSKPLESFDEETQGALRKVMYEQQRKQMGLPTTEEEKQLDMLKKAWNAEGSPFKGQPFDPSKLNLPQNSFQM